VDETTGRRETSTARLLNLSLFVMIGGAISVLVMQAVSQDWFPPEVSISQYGVGDYGWMLTVTLLFLAVASALLLWGADRQASTRQWSVVLPWGIWIIALTVMAFVPTNEWPEPLSLSGQIHQGAAIFGLFFAPMGAVFMVGVGRRDAQGSLAARARAAVIACACLSWLFLGLLLLTNIDIDITGMGYKDAWSLHQTVAVVLDIVMVFALIVCLRARERAVASQPRQSEPAYPFRSAGR